MAFPYYTPQDYLNQVRFNAFNPIVAGYGSDQTQQQTQDQTQQPAGALSTLPPMFWDQSDGGAGSLNSPVTSMGPNAPSGADYGPTSQGLVGLSGGKDRNLGILGTLLGLTPISGIGTVIGLGNSFNGLVAGLQQAQALGQLGGGNPGQWAGLGRGIGAATGLGGHGGGASGLAAALAAAGADPAAIPGMVANYTQFGHINGPHGGAPSSPGESDPASDGPAGSGPTSNDPSSAAPAGPAGMGGLPAGVDFGIDPGQAPGAPAGPAAGPASAPAGPSMAGIGGLPGGVDFGAPTGVSTSPAGIPGVDVSPLGVGPMGPVGVDVDVPGPAPMGPNPTSGMMSMLGTDDPGFAGVDFGGPDYGGQEAGHGGDEGAGESSGESGSAESSGEKWRGGLVRLARGGHVMPDRGALARHFLAQRYAQGGLARIRQAEAVRRALLHSASAHASMR